MRITRLFPLLVTVACSEYGYGSRPDGDDGTSSEDPADPAGPDEPGDDDTGEERDDPPDCEPDALPMIQRVPWVETGWDDERHRAFDFDADGRLIGLQDLAPWDDAAEIVRYTAFGDVEPLDLHASSSLWALDVRTLADGRIAWPSSTSAVDVFDPQDGAVDRVHLTTDHYHPFSLEPEGGGTFLMLDGFALDRVDPATDRTKRLREYLAPQDPLTGAPQAIALSRSEETLYVLFSDTTAPVPPVSIAAYPYDGDRLGEPAVLLPPTVIPGVSEWYLLLATRRLAVDACDNMYILASDALWIVPSGGGQAAPVVAFPSALLEGSNKTLFWGHDAGYADPQTLYVTGYEDTPEARPVRYAIHLGVDGNHVLSR